MQLELISGNVKQAMAGASVSDLWTDENGVRYRLVRPEIVSYAQKPVKINGNMVEQPNAEFTIITAEKISE